MRDERDEAGATLATRLEERRAGVSRLLATYTSNPGDPAHLIRKLQIDAALLDVAIAAERRRQARIEYDALLEEDAEPDIESGMWQRCVETLEAEDAALDALTAHLTATTAPDDRDGGREAGGG